MYLTYGKAIAASVMITIHTTNAPTASSTVAIFIRAMLGSFLQVYDDKYVTYNTRHQCIKRHVILNNFVTQRAQVKTNTGQILQPISSNGNLSSCMCAVYCIPSMVFLCDTWLFTGHERFRS